MTQIQASVNVKDNVDNSIYTKIEKIGLASEKTTAQINNLQKAVRSISSKQINQFSNSVSNLSRINLSALKAQMQQLANVSINLGNGVSQTALATIKLQTAQVKLQQEQVKLQILQQRLAQSSNANAIAQQRLAQATANATNASIRASTAQARLDQAQIRTSIATIRLQIEQERLRRQMEQTARSANQTNGSIMQLSSSMLTLAGIGGSAMGLALAGDEYQRLINKLMLVSDSATDARNRLATMADVAINSYSGIESVVQLYTRLNLALRQTGGTASEAIQITQTLSKATALAGLTTAEANSALLQISQAFNKGKLDGDEFRTVMETMPPLADAIARQFTKMNNGITVTRGELLKLAPEGKITGKVMKDAVLEMAEAIDQKFAQLTPTVSMQLQNLQTQAQMYFGSMFKDSGMASALGGAIKFIADNLDIATRLAIAFGGAITVAMARNVWFSAVAGLTAIKAEIKQATTLMGMFGAVTKATPIGWLVTGVTLLGATLDTVFNGAISKTIFPNFEQDQAKAQDYIARLKDIAGQLDLMTFTKLKQEQVLLDNAMQKNTESIKQQEKELTKIQSTIAKKEKVIADVTKRLEEYKDGTRRATEQIGAYGAVVNNQHNDIQLLAKIQKELLDAQTKEVELSRQLEETKENDIELQKVKLRSMEEELEKIDNARKAIEGKTEEDIKASEELQAQQKIVDKTKLSYDSLKGSILNLQSALRGFLGDSANLAPAMNNIVEQAEDKVRKETTARIREQAEWKKRYANASKEEQMRMDAEKSLSKDKERYRNQDGSMSKEWEELVNLQLEADKALQKRREADAKARQKEREANRKGISEAKKKANEIQKAREEYDRYLEGLENESVLLSQGYQNYTKYKELYALKTKLQQRGVELSDQQLQAIKAKIDANERARDLAKEINSLEENSLQKQREQLRLKAQALQQANITGADKQIAVDNQMSSMGAVGGVNQGVTGIMEQQNLYFQHLKELRQQDLISEQEYQMAMQSMSMQTQEQIYNQRLQNMEKMGGMWEVTATAFKSFEQNATSSIMNVLNGTQSISQAMRSLASTILTSVVQAIVQMGVKWLAQQAMQLAFGRTAQAVQMAQANALLAVYTPLASAVSLASYGANSAPAMAGMTATYSLGQALAVAGGRRNGGTVNAGDLYQVGEGNAPEIYQSRSGRQYMIAGDNGRVFSNKDVVGSGRSVVITQNITINGDGKLDADTLARFKEETRNTIYEVLADEQRDAGGMLA